MKTECVSDTNFQGKLFIQGQLSKVANSKVQKLKTTMEAIIRPKNYDLYIKQDYRCGLINFTASHECYPNQYGTNSTSIIVSSNTLNYVKAAQRAVNKYEKALSEKEQIELELKQKQEKKEDIKDTIENIVLSPLFLVNNILHSIKPKWSEKFEKLIIDRL